MDLRDLAAVEDALATIHRVLSRMAMHWAESSPNPREGSETIDQHDSALGPRRHCAAVRRRMAEGKEGAWRVKRDFLLSAEAYREELERCGKEEPPSPAEGEDVYQRVLSRGRRATKKAPKQ